jgi:hypothetical protein
MRRIRSALIVGILLCLVLPQMAAASRPTITIVDFSQFEEFAEADWLAECGFVVDVEFEGHIIIHEFSGPRLVEVDNWRTFMTYSANGKTFVAVHTLAGPDIFWIAADGTHYQATTGHSPFDGLIGRIVRNLDTDTVVSSHGRAIDNPLDDICAMIAP